MEPQTLALIIGCTLGGAILIIFILLLIVCCKLRARERQNPEKLKNSEGDDKFDFTNYALSKSTLPAAIPTMQYPQYPPPHLTPWSNYKPAPSSIVMPPSPAFEHTKVLPSNNRQKSDMSMDRRVVNPYSSLPVLPQMPYSLPASLPRQDSYPPSQGLQTHVLVNQPDTQLAEQDIAPTNVVLVQSAPYSSMSAVFQSRNYDSGYNNKPQKASDVPMLQQMSDGFSAATAFVAPVHQPTSSIISNNNDDRRKNNRVVATANTMDFNLGTPDNCNNDGDDIEPAVPSPPRAPITASIPTSTKVSGNPFVAKVQVTRNHLLPATSSTSAPSTDIVARAYNNYGSHQQLNNDAVPTATNNFTSMDNLRSSYGVPSARFGGAWRTTTTLKPDVSPAPNSLLQPSVVPLSDGRMMANMKSGGNDTIIEEEENVPAPLPYTGRGNDVGNPTSHVYRVQEVDFIKYSTFEEMNVDSTGSGGRGNVSPSNLVSAGGVQARVPKQVDQIDGTNQLQYIKNDRRPQSMYPPPLPTDGASTVGNQITVQAIIEPQPKEISNRSSFNRQSVVQHTDDIGDAFKFLDDFEE